MMSLPSDFQQKIVFVQDIPIVLNQRINNLEMWRKVIVEIQEESQMKNDSKTLSYT